MAKRIKVPCTACRSDVFGAVLDQVGFWPACPRCHGRGYIYERPPMWVCPICERHTQGLERCGLCRCDKPKEGRCS
jgi:rubrerythrin